MTRCLAIFLLGMSIFGSAASAQISPVPSAAAERAEAQQVQSSSYRLAAGDLVQVTVFGEGELNTSGRIGKDGAIIIPLVGLVKIAGQTVRDATRTVEGQLRRYLVKPQVALTIVNYTKRRFTILGQVGRPGTFDLPDETSINLLEAIGMAGGYTRLANPSHITVKRINGGQETTLKLDGKKMMKDQDTDPFQVLPGDTIVVAERIF